MKVLYDISWLGDSRGKASGPTGLGRVVETLAYHLGEQPRCDLTLCASYSYSALIGCLDLLQTDEQLARYPFAYSKPAFYHSWLDDAVANLHRKERPSVLTRVLRKGAGYANAIAQRGYSPIDLASFRDADIYHSPFLRIPSAAREVKGLKCALTVYDLIPVLFPELAPDGSLAMLQQTMASLRAEDTVMCISEATKADLCNYLTWLDPEKVIVTYLAASENFRPLQGSEVALAIRKKYGIPEGTYFLALGSLEPRKGLDHLSRCFFRLISETNISDLYLVIAGPKGWKFAEIFQVIDEFPLLKNRIIVTGRIDDSDLPYLYSDAFGFVFPSIYEGFGLPALEAMQCGTPVIASNTSSLPEVIGDAGILVAQEMPMRFAMRCWNSIEISDRRTALAAKAIERARLFSWEKCAQATISAYEKTLSS